MTTKTRPTHRARRTSGRRPHPNRRRGLVSPVAMLIGGAAVLALIATVLTLGGEDAGPQTAAVTIAGELLPAYDASAPDAAIGLAAPAIEGTDSEGRQATIRSEGRPMAIVFLAHWCSHCQNEVRDLTPWIERGGAPVGVDLWAVSTFVDDRAPNYPPTTWLERVGWPVVTVLDDEGSTASRAFGMAGTPFWVFVAADGTVMGRVSGEVGPARLGTILDRLASS